MSNKPAAIPLFADAYLADTMHLSTEEHGAYLLLLMAAWRFDDCSLPNDDKKLSRIVGLSARRWSQMADTIREFWQVDGDRIFNARLRKERGYVRQKSESNRENARKRWSEQTTENKQSGECDRISDGNAPPPPPIVEEPKGPSTPPTPKKGKGAKGKKLPDIDLPDWIPSEPWNGFIEMRVEKGAVPTARAMKLLVEKLSEFRSKGHDPTAVLNKSTTNNWTDLYEPKETPNGNRSSPARSGASQPQGRGSGQPLTAGFQRRAFEAQSRRVAEEAERQDAGPFGGDDCLPYPATRALPRA